MIWPERWAIGVAVLAVIFFFFMTGPDFTFQFAAVFAGGLGVISWVIFRTLDFMFAGPAQRRSRAQRDR